MNFFLAIATTLEAQDHLIPLAGSGSQSVSAE
jgi:hypothetical protein